MMEQRRIPQKSEESCKIRIKKTIKGKEISFQGKCSKEQIDVARSSIGEEDGQY